jgi:FMN phosphatase YigB (HAD superfamily)
LRFSSVFFDVDDVMLDMDRIAGVGVDAVRAPLEEALGAERAARVQATFHQTYRTLIRQLRSGAGTLDPEFAELRDRIRAWERGVTEAGFELKMFSRHVLMAIALDHHGIRPTARLIQGTADAYWSALAEATDVFPDARVAIDRLREDGTPFQLATNSDGFLDFDEARQTFTYDPPDAVRRKLERLDALRGIGIADAQISVGDPIGKPSPPFYRGVLEEFERFHGHAPDLSLGLAAGDSLTSDVLPFLDAGVRYGAWLQRQRTEGPALLPDRPNVAVIRDLTELWSVPWPAP